MTDKPDYVLTDTSHLEGSQMETGWIRIDLIPSLFCEDNPKLHDLSKLWQSIARDGFIDPAKLDFNLTNIEGTKPALVYGHGRNEALYQGWQQWQLGEHDIIPEGIKYDDDYWYVPISYGLDAKSEAQAQDILLFHNSSTMLGGDFADGDIWRMYDKEKLAQLSKAMVSDSEDENFEPISMDKEEVSDLLHYLSGSVLSGQESVVGNDPSADLEIFENASIKQIVLYFDLDSYDEFVEKLARVMESEDVPNHTQVVIFLMEYYENHKGD